jgi:hypothetical protein
MTNLADAIILARHHGHPADRAVLDRAVRKGRLVRLIVGAYVDAAVWQAFDGRERHLLRAHAARLIRRRRLVFSHWTAAAVWGLPLVDPLPESVHVVAEPASGGRTDSRLVRHCVGIPEPTTWLHGLEVTGLARTVMDLARIAPFPTSVAVADAALARGGGVTRDELEAHVGPPRHRGAARAARVAAFADAGSGSPGESVSRASMALAGIPRPVLQHRFDDQTGAMFVDFWWPRFGLVGEFDGAVKYDDPVFLRGRTPQQALLDEKRREDRIRALGPRVTRWGWDVARSPGRLRAQLVAAGIRDERYRDW